MVKKKNVSKKKTSNRKSLSPHNQPIKIENQCFYIIHPKHRDGKDPDASQWIISEDEEKQCFATTLSCAWIIPENVENLCKEGQFGWGIKTGSKKTLEYLGHIGKNRGQKKVKLAKFRNEKQIKQGNWHGYPANYLENSQDIPPEFILKIWKNEGYINKSIMSKIKKGKPCKQIQE
ncbi:MAG: hypothetical protein H7A23_15300 [Leptospiraceae bacterium]|nr:hypothetical protein [Leptospiraceae bacterium]